MGRSADWPSFALWMEELGQDAPEFGCPDGMAVDDEGRPELLPVLTDAASLASKLEELAPQLNWSVTGTLLKRRRSGQARGSSTL